MTHDEILEMELDALYIPLPSAVRNKFMEAAILKGKHIYSEKPHHGTVAEFKAILDLAASSNIQFMDGTMWYHSNRTKEIAKRKEKMGKVRRVSASFTWGNGLVDEEWIQGGIRRIPPKNVWLHWRFRRFQAWFFLMMACTKVQACMSRERAGAAITYEHLQQGGGCDLVASAPQIQFEIVCDKGVLKVEDLVGGQKGQGTLQPMNSFIGSSSFVLGDALGKDVVVATEPVIMSSASSKNFVLLFSRSAMVLVHPILNGASRRSQHIQYDAFLSRACRTVPPWRSLEKAHSR